MVVLIKLNNFVCADAQQSFQKVRAFNSEKRQRPQGDHPGVDHQLYFDDTQLYRQINSVNLNAFEHKLNGSLPNSAWAAVKQL